GGYADSRERERILARFESGDAIGGAEVAWKRKDGGRILVRRSGRAVRRGNGRIECFETIAEDITERRALEEQLRQSQKMEAIGQLTGGIAHDFNNLLTIILVNAQLIAKALPTERGDAHADLRDVMSAALRGRVMVQELLGFARRSSLDLQSTDLSGLVADLSGLLRRTPPADAEVGIAGGRRLAAGRGTGLGLATVYGLVKQHGAGIEVDTASGKGTRFRIYFPVAEHSAAAASRGEKGEPEIRGGTETILVVEDDDQLRRSAKRILEDAGYQVVTAADGQEALDVLRHQGPSIDLVLSDLVMPRLGGRALYDA